MKMNECSLYFYVHIKTRNLYLCSTCCIFVENESVAYCCYLYVVLVVEIAPFTIVLYTCNLMILMNYRTAHVDKTSLFFKLLMYIYQCDIWNFTCTVGTFYPLDKTCFDNSIKPRNRLGS